MAVLKILTYPNPILKEKAAPVTDFAEAGIDVRDLIDTLKASPGVGLAAPQIGKLTRIIAVDVTPKEAAKKPKGTSQGLIILINPEITELTDEKIVREGCLSVPEYTANVKRYGSVRVKGFTPEGTETTIESTGLEAICLQHEIDHLDGILFLDRIESVRKDLFKRKVKNPQA